LNRSVRTGVFLAAGAGVAALLVLAATGLPPFGSSYHPYRDLSVAAAVHHETANVVSSVNFDQRGLDTLGEESILLASVIGAALLLRPADDETETFPLERGRVLDATRLIGYLMMPVTMIVGLDVIAHGHLTPGGGFQGGVIVGTAVHLLYVAGSYRALEKARPVGAFEWGEAVGAGAFACLGIAAVFVGGAFLSDVIPNGSFGNLFSAGTVALLNGAVGIEVASGTAVLLAKFLDQAILVKPGTGQGGNGSRK
jgi:multicomponent Na+:H+ antiporter subunit B